jgi:hypothetical protein
VPIGNTNGVWVGNPGVFRDLTEKVLAVYRLKPSAELRLELEPKTIKFGLLAVCGPIDHILSGMIPEIAEAFGDPIEGTGASNDELRFIEHEHRGIIQIDCILERQKWPETRISRKDLVYRT